MAHRPAEGAEGHLGDCLHSSPFCPAGPARAGEGAPSEPSTDRRAACRSPSLTWAELGGRGAIRHRRALPGITSTLSESGIGISSNSSEALICKSQHEQLNHFKKKADSHCKATNIRCASRMSAARGWSAVEFSLVGPGNEKLYPRWEILPGHKLALKDEV